MKWNQTRNDFIFKFNLFNLFINSKANWSDASVLMPENRWKTTKYSRKTGIDERLHPIRVYKALMNTNMHSVSAMWQMLATLLQPQSCVPLNGCLLILHIVALISIFFSFSVRIINSHWNFMYDFIHYNHNNNRIKNKNQNAHSNGIRMIENYGGKYRWIIKITKWWGERNKLPVRNVASSPIREKVAYYIQSDE